MELHQPLSTYEARFGSLGSSSPFQSIPDFNYFGSQAYRPPSSSQYPAQPVSSPHGTTSSFQFYYNIPLEDSHSRKRRRLTPNTLMSPSNNSPRRGLAESTPSVSYTYESRDDVEGQPTRHCVDHGLSSPQYYGASIARGMANLGQMLLCPCCGFDWRRTGGHHSIPESPPHNPLYDTKTPYMVEKPPIMQPSMSTGGSLTLDTQVHTELLAFADPPPRSMVKPPEALHTTAVIAHETIGARTHAAAPSVIHGTELVKSESHFSALGSPPTWRFGCGDQRSAQGPDLVATSSPASLQSPAGITTMPFGLSMGPMLVDKPETIEAPLLETWHNVSAVIPEQSPLTSSFEVLLPNQRGGKRGPFRDQVAREQTAQTRKRGSCIRCRIQRIRCESNLEDPNADCVTCERVTKSKAGRFPCLRYKLTDIRMYKPGPVPGYEWTRRWNHNISDPIQRWASPDTVVIRLSEGYSRRGLELRVRQFVPQEGDKLERTWDYNGSKRSVSIPPFALVDLEEGRQAYAKYIGDSMADTFPRVLGPQNGLLYKTYLQAWRLCRDRSSTSVEALELLRCTFRLWMSIRLSSSSIFIIGEEKLGMPNDILDETNPNHGKIPIPPVLGAQTDVILIHHVQTKLRRELLDRLQKFVLKSRQDSWLLVYLVTFILLHNAAMIMAHDAKYARKHGMKRRFAREDEVAEYHLGANILLAHFHYCNKGFYPFSDECRDKELRTLADLDDEKMQFVHETREYVKQHKQQWDELQEKCAYEHDYFFVSQLFEKSWLPRDMK